jgi:hypothetical protein
MVMLETLLELTHTMAKAAAFAVLKMKLKNAKLLEVDYRAIDAGIDCIRKQIAGSPCPRGRVDARFVNRTEASPCWNCAGVMVEILRAANYAALRMTARCGV